MSRSSLRRWLLAAALLTAAACQKVDRTNSQAPSTAPGKELPPEVVTSSGIRMILIPAGRFLMGSDDGQSDQQPAHEVQIDAFLMDRYEVTQAAYAQVDPINGSHFKGAELPTEMISWGKAALYCNLRSEAEGLQPCYNELGECDFAADGYRLPTEAEWEYACRAGSVTRYAYGSDPGQLDRYAWYAINSSKKTHAVGKKQPNAWGLFDMHGNVAEWCNDFYDPDYYRQSPPANPRGPAGGRKKVLRGGHWAASAEACQSAFRFGEEPGFSDACFARDAIGFRCVRRPTTEVPEPVRGVAGTITKPISAKEGQIKDAGKSSQVGLVSGEIYLRHDTGSAHPERSRRLTAIVDRLQQVGLLDQLTRIEPRPADESWLTTVHTPGYLTEIRQLCEQEEAMPGRLTRRFRERRTPWPFRPPEGSWRRLMPSSRAKSGMPFVRSDHRDIMPCETERWGSAC